ncbi:MAG: DinB family protein [Bacteroidota bacterium]
MKTVFDQEQVEIFKSRLGNLETSASAKWGKMNVKQMLKHCIENEKLFLRERQFKDVFIGKLFGRIALRSDIKNDQPFGKNSPTHPDLKMTEEIKASMDSLKSEWIRLLEKYPDLAEDYFEGFVHPFFRKMSKEEVGIWATKHVDHHLRQFGY